MIDHIRGALAIGIEEGKVHLDRIFVEKGLKTHPSIAVIELAGKVDAIISDDRFFNQHSKMEGKPGESVIWTSLDLLDILQVKNIITKSDCWNYRTILRQAGLIHIPSSTEELATFVSNSRIRDSNMIETGELRAFRENIELTQMRGWLNLPHESPWLNKLVSDLVQVIRMQWTDEISDADARARSRWLLKRADMRNWAGQIVNDGGDGMARYGLIMPINSLLLSPAKQNADKSLNRLAIWLEEEINAIKFEDPTIYSWLIDCLRNVITSRLDEEGNINAE